MAAEDVAGLIGVKETTVWRWCREGTLPCLKVGRRWRIRREVFEDFLRRSEQPVTLVGELDSFLRVPDSVLAIAQNLSILRRLDSAFFGVGESRGGLLVKFFGGEEDTEEGMLASFEEHGLAAGRLKQEGRLLLRPEEEPVGGSRGEALVRLVEEQGGEGRTVWASFDWAEPVDLETTLRQQAQLTELVDVRHLVVKTAAVEGAMGAWTPSQLRRAQSVHSATILASEEGLSFTRARQMPSS